ncbi:cell division protein FtsW [Candidatus Berkelbacteria bacterium RBG_13_40_8]|uniref:Probable peptidoglycan glycosyltransferase FtsW n=1 Tax=Candidatus Berkelbacteria bacterium RBG_13_40_8 TaxID=1797467 RepID=A0A1F5DNC8_9BACT|nr:MAG: cell division protein FtsW [Candidatus Berkelbacteria bacterium RBG_13_40_8]
MRTLSQKTKRPDYIFALIILILSLFGIIMVASSSMVISQEKFGSNYYFAGRQALNLLIGIILMIVTYHIDYRFWKKNAFWMFLITITLLILVFVPGVGHKFGGAQRWIGFGPIMFQPAEIIKLTFLIYLAAWLEKKADNVKTFFTGFIPFFVLIGVIGFLIMKQPDFGTLTVIVATAAVMFFISGANIYHLCLGVGSLTVLAVILIKAAPYRLQRLLVFLNPSIDSQGAAYHINQALLAIGTGGLWGLGFGGSKQKYLYLPQVHTDSIFAIIAEEMGFIRASLVLLMFLCIGFRGYKIAKNAPDNFSKFLSIGITSWILIQAFINLASMLNLVPMTGVPLPFISFGGSSLIILLAATGIMLNISKHAGEKT